MRIIIGNILDVTHGVIAHQVNCRGVMGGGVAKVLRDKYPAMYENYRVYCALVKHAYEHQKHRNPRTLLGDNCYFPVGRDLTIACMFAQDNYGTDKYRLIMRRLRAASSFLWITIPMSGYICRMA